MAMKALYYIISIGLVVIIASYAITISENKRLKEDNARLSQNLEQYGRNISELTLTYQQIKTEKEKGDVRIQKADSILKKNALTIKQLQRLLTTRVDIVETDTIIITDTIIKKVQNSNLYDVIWRDERNCITVEGIMRSTDPTPQIAITKRAATVEVYDIKAKRRWFQFWRPKYIRVVHSPCGEVQVLEINKKE